MEGVFIIIKTFCKDSESFHYSENFNNDLR